jgi:uncharacterized protein YdeI (YjbR/CyaY-like superfamily)
MNFWLSREWIIARDCTDHPTRGPMAKPSRKSAKPPKALTKKGKRAIGASAEPTRTFKTAGDFARWLEKNHSRSSGVWARIAKKGGGLKSMTYQEGLEVALCYGWIDALKRPQDESAWLQRFVPRRPKSLWSRINRDKALALVERGEMKPAGHAEIERAKGDGRWDAAYDSPAKASVPPELEAALAGNPKAKAFFEQLDRINRYAIIWRIQTATKPETRERRLSTLLEMLEKGQTLH